MTDRERIEQYLPFLEGAGKTFELYPVPKGVTENRFTFARLEALSLTIQAPGGTEVRVSFTLIEFVCERAQGGAIRLTRATTFLGGCLL